jgi:16S rRNA (guanine966-N2)-methyltransferase
VEKDRKALDALTRNLARLGAAERAEVRAQAVEHAPAPGRRCDLLFMDPPYRAGLAQAALDRVPDWLAPGGWASLETDGEEISVPDRLVLDAERRFGKARILLLRPS